MKALDFITFHETSFSSAPEAMAVAQKCQETLFNLMWDRYQKSLRGNPDSKGREFPLQWDPEAFMSNWTGYLLEIALVKYLGLSHHAWVDIRLKKFQVDPDLDEHLPDLFPNVEVRSFNGGIKSKDLRGSRQGHRAVDSIWVFGSCDQNGQGRFHGWLPGGEIFSKMKKGRPDQYGRHPYSVIEDNLRPMDTLYDYVYGHATQDQEEEMLG